MRKEVEGEKGSRDVFGRVKNHVCRALCPVFVHTPKPSTSALPTTPRNPRHPPALHSHLGITSHSPTLVHICLPTLPSIFLLPQRHSRSTRNPSHFVPIFARNHIQPCEHANRQTVRISAVSSESNISSLLEVLQCDDEDIIVDTLRTLQKVASGVYSCRIHRFVVILLDVFQKVDQMTGSMIGVHFCLHCVVSLTHLDLWSRFLFC
ncbi:hypothetical protein BLNAU_20189 [Blattamonas nauphoetae]|uniref:Uncharacterized protein n=1 Tax=Blattamonas nauphoetae TaxID=2049346 RepID=A0ABQ9WZE9_9EUKA|nr:hypothetical protein BLNAU_20189 [Blattamonas nauphoetae]